MDRRRPTAADDAALVRDFSLEALPDAFYDDPYPTYHALQNHDPVHRMPDGSLFLTRHSDLEAIYKDTTRFSSDNKVEFAPKYGADSLLFEHHTTSLVFNDPPLHTRVRTPGPARPISRLHIVARNAWIVPSH
jgi:cytochrome P450